MTTCSDCRFFRDETCHASPPIVVRMGEGYSERRPHVSANDPACRNHQEFEIITKASHNKMMATARKMLDDATEGDEWRS